MDTNIFGSVDRMGRTKKNKFRPKKKVHVRLTVTTKSRKNKSNVKKNEEGSGKEASALGRLPYHGSVLCMREGCSRKAYYAVGVRPMCGQHSRSAAKDGTRIQLPRDPIARQKKEAELKHHTDRVAVIASENKVAGRKGTITTFKLPMMKSPPLVDGVLNVFPNARHGSRKDGLGLANLSPKRLGPLYHGQPTLPPAKSIENFHQGSKVFWWYYDRSGDSIRPEFFAMQKAMFECEEAYRHQWEFLVAHPHYLPPSVTLEQVKKHATDPSLVSVPSEGKEEKKRAANKNAPEFSVWRKTDGTLVRLSYVESRQLYCAAFAELVVQQPQWRQLADLVWTQGTNICIVGYDAQPLDRSSMTRYLDPSKPFGHEDVIATMLMDPEDTWPWRLCKTLEFEFRATLAAFSPLLSSSG